MPIFEVEHNGTVYEADAPDMESAANAIKGMAGGGEAAPAPSGGFLNDEDKVGGRFARLMVQGVPRAFGSTAALVGDIGINTGLAGANVVQRARGAPEFANPPLPLSTALTNSTERWASQLGLPEMPKEGIAGYVGRGLEVGTEALGGAGLAGLAARGLRRAAPEVAAGIGRLAEGPATQVAAGLAGQAGSEAAGYLAPDSMAARLIGAGLGTVGGLGGSVAARGAWQAARRGVGDQGEAVARTIATQASDPNQLVQDLSRPSVNAPGGLTAAQQSGDAGLLALERDVMRNTETGPARAAQRRAEQAQVQNEQLNAIQPGGDTSHLQTFVRDLLQRADEAGEAGEQTARTQAQTAVEEIRPVGGAEGVGAATRGNIREARQAYRADIEKPLWDAVDPEGRLVVPTQSAREAAHEAYGTLDPRAQRRLGADERAFAEDVGQLGPEVPFRHLQTLESDLKDAMRAENRAAGETAKYRRLGIMQRAVRGAMSEGALREAQSNPSVASRLEGMRNEYQAGTGAGDSGAVGENAALRAGAVPLPRDAEGAGVGGSGGAARPGSVQAAPGRPKKGLTLSQFIARNGGLALDDEAAARDFGNVTVPGVGGKLARPNGKPIDGFWRNKLIDEGYLPPDADGGASRDITKELYDALEAERAGRVTRTAQDERQMPLSAADDEGAAHAAAVAQIRDEWKRAGMREQELHSGALQDAAERVARGEETNGLHAYERAVMALDEAPTPRPSYPEVPEPPGGFPNALKGDQRDPELGARYNAATGATRTKHDIWTRSAAGPVLKTTGQQGDFRMPATAVPSTVFIRGPEGANRVRAMVRAGATPQNVGDAAALSLLEQTRDGVLTPQAFETWRRTHADAIGALPPDVLAQFGSASLAGERLGRAVARRRTVMADAQRSALGKVAGAGGSEDLQGRISSMLGSKGDAQRQIGQLLQATRDNEPARDGLKRAILDDILGRAVSDSSEAGVSGADVGAMTVSANKLAGLLRTKRGLLTQVFGEPHVQTMEAVADDIVKAQRSTSGGVKIPGGSDTAQNISRQLDRSARKLAEHGLLGTIITRGSWGAALGSKAGPVGSAVGGAAGGLVGLGEAAIGAARASGIKRFDDLMVETLLDPALTRAAAARGIGLKNADTSCGRRLLERSRKMAAPTAGLRPGQRNSEDSE